MIEVTKRDKREEDNKRKEEVKTTAATTQRQNPEVEFEFPKPPVKVKDNKVDISDDNGVRRKLFPTEMSSKKVVPFEYQIENNNVKDNGNKSDIQNDQEIEDPVFSNKASRQIKTIPSEELGV